jgi:hypothetical protein
MKRGDYPFLFYRKHMLKKRKEIGHCTKWNYINKQNHIVMSHMKNIGVKRYDANA